MEELCLFHFCLFYGDEGRPTLSISSLNTSQTISADVPFSYPWAVISSFSASSVCLSLPFHFVVLCCRLCKVSIGLATSFLPSSVSTWLL